MWLIITDDFIHLVVNHLIIANGVAVAVFGLDHRYSCILGTREPITVRDTGRLHRLDLQCCLTKVQPKATLFGHFLYLSSFELIRSYFSSFFSVTTLSDPISYNGPRSQQTVPDPHRGRWYLGMLNGTPPRPSRLCQCRCSRCEPYSFTHLSWT